MKGTYGTSSFCNGCQKNVPIFKRFFYNRTPVYAAIPQLRNFEHYYEKRYNDLKTINRLIQKRIALGTYFKNSRSRSLFSRSAGDMRIDRSNF